MRIKILCIIIIVVSCWFIWHSVSSIEYVAKPTTTSRPETVAVIPQDIERNIDLFSTAKTTQEKTAILDTQIDEFQARRLASANRSEERGSTSRPDREMRNRDLSTADRKLRFESQSPDKQARRMAYFAALRNRMKERGIEPPTRSRS